MPDLAPPRPAQPVLPLLPLLPLLSDLPRIGPGPQRPPGPSDVHIWHHPHRAGTAPEPTAALLADLSPAERTHAAGLRDNHRRQQFVVGRALCRRVLSSYTPVPPQHWRFTLGSRGKPVIAAPTLPAPLWFNLSHTDGASVCAVTGAGPDIGVDIEQKTRGPDTLEIAEQFFPQAELGQLRHLPPAQRDETFMRIWALKESYVKARETSLTDGIRGTAFDLTQPKNIRVTFHHPLHEQAQQWRFHLHQLDPTRIVALSLRTHTPGPLKIQTGTAPSVRRG